MRITGGEFCGRKLRVPAGERVRPTQDRVREALFSILMHKIKGALFIDLYAGSGAVGLEALSRGAAHVIWLEKEPRHIKTLRANLDALALERGEVVCGEVERWLRTAGCGRAADIAFADPPYSATAADDLAALMELAALNNVVAIDGIFVMEMPLAAAAAAVAGWELLRDRKYGHTRLAVYQRR
ncbi:MAG: 16S rRNA (guanine(966)-N(2))-methyltransferase RsmD [Kiritimatiellae bacterium]|nr:16S rRNA (guanine(966)-N(2))-methyltransferase RsmD [Kiritimatiellia bacterium]